MRINQSIIKHVYPSVLSGKARIEEVEGSVARYYTSVDRVLTGYSMRRVRTADHIRGRVPGMGILGILILNKSLKLTFKVASYHNSIYPKQ